MDTRNALLPTLATLLAGFLVTAPAVAQETQDVHGQVKESAASKASLGVPLLFSVEGLTKDNVEKVTRSLTSLTQNVYVCSGCKHVGGTAGKCIPCDVELEAKKEPILFEAVPSFKKESEHPVDPLRRADSDLLRSQGRADEELDRDRRREVPPRR
jgi:hypothetical protein